MSSVSDYQVDIWLDQFVARRSWLGLLAADPGGVSDVLTIEVQGPVYRRPEASWRRANPRLLVTRTSTQFLGLPDFTTVFAAAVFDAPYNGNLLAILDVPEPRTFPIGGSYKVPAGELYFGFS